MARRGGSLYVSTDPLNVVPIGVPGVGVSLGPMGTWIFASGDPGNNPRIITPINGQMVNISANPLAQNAVYVLEGTATLPGIILVMANGTVDGQGVYITSQIAVTTLSFTGTVVNQPVALTAGQTIRATWAFATGWTFF